MVRVYRETREELYANAWTTQLDAGENFDEEGTLGGTSGPAELGGQGAASRADNAAERATATAEAARTAGREEAAPSDALNDLTVAELRELAAEEDVDLGGATKKAEIVAALRAEGVE